LRWDSQLIKSQLIGTRNVKDKGAEPELSKKR